MKELVEQYLQECETMQLATTRGDQPWLCTVHFVADEQQNLYWLSLPERRHSQEISAHDRVAVAIAVKTDQPVIGIQADGRAVVVNDPEVIKRVMQSYVEKFKTGSKFYDNFVAGNNQHQLYKFVPELYVLFDEQHFSGDAARQEWRYG